MPHFVESGFFTSLLKISAEAGVLILFVTAAQRLLRRQLTPRWRYSLWLLVCVRLALPWTVASPASVFNVLRLPAFSAPSASTGTIGAPRTLSPVTAPAALKPGKAMPPAWHGPSGSGPNAAWFAIPWFTGVLVFFALVLATYVRLARRVNRLRPVTEERVLNLLEDCKELIGVRAPVILVETADVGSPALFGFVRPRLLLPAGLVRDFSLIELRHVFLHELGHIKRRDIPIGWVMTVLQIVHWFNPLVWLAFRRMRADREMACDALALSCLHEQENQSYGGTIIKLLENFGRSAWAPSLAGTVESRHQIKERISMIAEFKHTTRGTVWPIVLFLALALTTLTDAQTAGSSRELVGTWVLVGRPGHVGQAPAEGGRLKSITPTHWSVTQSDTKTGAVLFHHGGTYTLRGDEYAEHIDFANAATTNLVGHTSRFHAKIEGDTLTLLGINNDWKEVWKRAPATPPHKIDPTDLQGSWTGGESDEQNGKASMTIKGSEFDFHGTNTNEWYKATFTAYDTTPKQLVIVINDCPFPDYVGRTSYAIYKLENGSLTVAGNEPGNPTAPADFDAQGARKFVFKSR